MKGEIKKEATREGRKNDMKPTVKKDAKWKWKRNYKMKEKGNGRIKPG